MRPVSWLAVLIQLVLVGMSAVVVAWIFRISEFPLAIFFGAIALSLIYRIARAVFTSDHRRGIKLLRPQKFAEGASCFEASYAAFQRRPWLDRFRWLLLGSASSMSYREMALCNAAFCYGQIGNGARTTALYEQALREFPDSGLAAASLNLLRSVQPPG